MSGSLKFADGLVNGQYARVLRDSGCTVVCVKKKFIPQASVTGKVLKCKTITGQVVQLDTANASLDTPYFKGQSVVCVLPNDAVADVIVGNVSGVVDCSSTATEHEVHYGCALTRAASKRKKINQSLCDNFISLHTSPEEFKRAQSQDESLRHCFQKASEQSDNEFSFVLENDFLYRIHTSQKHGETKQLVVPFSFRHDILRIAHDIPLAGHQGIKRTKERVSQEFYWPGIYKDVNKFVRSCAVCQKASHKGGCSKAPLQELPHVGIPFHKVSVDLVGPLIKSDRNHLYILTVVDFATRWPEALPMRDISSEGVAEALNSIFSRVGYPQEVLSDNGPQFVSGLMEEVLRTLGIKHVCSSPYHPQSNGLCERMNGTIKHMLRKVATSHPHDWDRLLPSVLFAYRELPQNGSGFSPFELLYGRSPRGPMTILRELFTNIHLDADIKPVYQYVVDLERRIVESCQLAQVNLQKSAETNAEYSDLRSKLREFGVGDKVLILLPVTKNKLLMTWKGPYQIWERCSKVNYRIKIGKSIKTFHVNMLKEFIDREVSHKKESNPCQHAMVASLVHEDVPGIQYELENSKPNVSSSSSMDEQAVVASALNQKQNEIMTSVSTDTAVKSTFVEYDMELTSVIPVFDKNFEAGIT